MYGFSKKGEKKIKHPKKKAFFSLFYKKNQVKNLGHKSVFFLLKRDKKSLRKIILMKYIGQCLVIFLDHTNMSNFHVSILDGNTTPKIF